MNLLKSKTFWTGIAAVMGGLAGYFTGEMTIGIAGQMVITGLIGIFLRHSIAKGK